MTETIEVEHEFIFDENDVPSLEGKDYLYTVKIGDNRHLLRLVDRDCFDWIIHELISNPDYEDSRSAALRLEKRHPPGGKYHSFKRRGEKWGSLETRPVPDLVLDAILAFRRRQSEEQQRPSRFQAIMMEMSKEY